MTVPVQTTYTASIANGATTVFPYGFKIAASEDLAVTVDGVRLTSGYTVSGVGNPAGGNVTITVPPANGAKVVRYLSPVFKRDTDYQQFGDWLAAVVNLDFDRIWLTLQTLQQNDIRSLKLPVDTAVDQVLTQDATARANRTIKFDGAGNLTISTYDPDGAQASAAASATAAATSATSAAGSATSASGSATAASGSATSAASSAAAALAAVGSVLVSANDTTAAKLSSKLVAGSGVTLTVQNPGANENIKIDASVAGFKNKIINGGMQIVQRGAVALSATANTTYCADRITVQASGGTGLAGNGANATSGGNTRSGYIAGAMACNWTNATMKVQTRLEDVNVISLNGKTITVSGKLYHDIGSTRSCQVVVQKANSANNFSATTTLGTSATFQANSGAYTSFSYTLALGGSDATNGLLISVEDTAASTVTGKTFAVGDLQLEEGAVATQFEVRPYGIELALCLRYLPSISAGGGNGPIGNGYVNSTTTNGLVAAFLPVPARVPPTGLTASSASHISVSDSDSSTALSGVSFNSATVNSAMVGFSIGTARTAYRPHYAFFNNTAGNIQFTGCEL